MVPIRPRTEAAKPVHFGLDFGLFWLKMAQNRPKKGQNRRVSVTDRLTVHFVYCSLFYSYVSFALEKEVKNIGGGGEKGRFRTVFCSKSTSGEVNSWSVTAGKCPHSDACECQEMLLADEDVRDTAGQEAGSTFRTRFIMRLWGLILRKGNRHHFLNRLSR
jgi:hypothetical protein